MHDIKAIKFMTALFIVSDIEFCIAGNNRLCLFVLIDQYNAFLLVQL